MTAISEIKQVILESLVDHLHLLPHDAQPIAEQVIEKLAQRFGGESPYIPIRAEDIRERNERIRREFDGRNHRQLAERYNLSVRTIYRILTQKS